MDGEKNEHCGTGETNLVNGKPPSKAEVASSYHSGVKEKSSCNEPDISLLLKLIQDVYSKRLSDIENDNNFSEIEKANEKFIALQSYVQQLHDQNETFASTMVELEKEALQRVKQMEKRLKSSAKTTMEAVINMHECEKEMRRLVEERLYIESLYKDSQHHLSSIKVENGFLRDQNFNLNHDVQALLHVIHHARSTGHWEMDCVTFCEVTPEQVFGPVQSISLNYGTDYDSQIFSRDSKKVSTNSDVFSLGAASIYTSSPHHTCIRPKKKANFASIQFHSSCLPRCVSLPEIGNIYSFNQTVHKSNSYDSKSKKRTLGMQLSNHSKIGPRKTQDTPELLKYVSHVRKLEERFCIRKGQSEPHLFMFNDNIYKYRPCEPIEKASSDALNDNYQSSLPPYQSIDLKFPTEESSLKINAWNKLKTGSYLDDHENSYYKDHSTISSCSCSESEVRGLNKQMYRLFREQCTHCDNISTFSLGIQVESDRITQGTQVNINDMHCVQDGISENSMIQMLKDNLTKANNKAEEKRILIEQLHNHITSAVKEVELKDKALENLEKKLQSSRDECSVLKNQVGDLSSEIQLVLKDLEETRLANVNLKIQVEQQGQIIRTLQEALVQSKRAFDAAHSKLPSYQGLNTENLQSKSRQTSKSSIVDI